MPIQFVYDIRAQTYKQNKNYPIHEKLSQQPTSAQYRNGTGSMSVDDFIKSLENLEKLLKQL